MLKIIITSLYWIMNIIRYIIITPLFICKCLLFICKYLMAFIHYIVDIGFCFSLFNPEETYKLLKDIINEIESDEIYVIVFVFIIIPGFILAIPAFIIRHIYLTWLFIKEKYNELNTIDNQQE